MKLLYVDVETTGVNPKTNGIVQLSGIIEVDGVEKEEFDFRMKPFPNDDVTQEALDITGLTLEDISLYPDPKEIYKKFIGMLDKYIDRYKKNKSLSEKFYLVGQNVGFDNSMISEWFKKCGDKYWYSYRHPGFVDLICITTMFEIAGLYTGQNKKLETVAKEFGIEFAAHNSLADIKATKQIFYKYINKLKK